MRVYLGYISAVLAFSPGPNAFISTPLRPHRPYACEILPSDTQPSPPSQICLTHQRDEIPSNPEKSPLQGQILWIGPILSIEHGFIGRSKTAGSSYCSPAPAPNQDSATLVGASHTWHWTMWLQQTRFLGWEIVVVGMRSACWPQQFPGISS